MATHNPFKNKRVLITCGPTWVPIDKVRVISNCSSGELGHMLVDRLVSEGAKVTLLQGPTTYPLRCQPQRLITFKFFDELQKFIKQELRKHYDIVIHAAAVSDYKLSKAHKKKLSSNLSHLRLHLVPTPKIILQIKKLAPKTLLVGFKLEANLRKQTIRQRVAYLFRKAECDLVVANSVHNKNYRAYIINKGKQISGQASNRKTLVKQLVHSIKAQL